MSKLPARLGGAVHIHHDFETYCEIDVRKVGSFCYSMDESCDVLMLSWLDPRDGELYSWLPPFAEPPDGWDDGNTFYGPELPANLRELAEDPEVQFHAHNAMFEYCIWNNVVVRRYGAPPIAADRYVCTAVMCAASGLPRSLEKAGEALGLDIQKDKEGSKLINVFCKLQPARKPTKKNPEGVPPRRIMPQDELEKFARFLEYNRTDVLTEAEIPKYVPHLSKREQMYFGLDLKMNERGLPLDMKAVRRGLPVLTELETRVRDKVTTLTGGIRPSQRDKMLEFFSSLGLDLENLQAKTLKDLLLLKSDELTDTQIELLQLRVEGGKASTKKLKTMLLVVCQDGRVRGGFLFYGAHTGRWSGKLIQPQNFPRGEYKPHQLEQLMQLLYHRDPDILEILYEWPIDAVAQAMRGFIMARPGKKFVVSDFSAIEARMLAWLADEKPVLAIYHANGDVYIRMASKLYKVDEAELKHAVKVLEDKEAVKKRKFSKDIVLGCGYQMGGPGFYRNCIMRGVPVEEEQCKEAVRVYRKEHPAIVKFWADVERCSVLAVKQKRTIDNPIRLRSLTFYTYEQNGAEWFCIGLPSGRPLRYFRPKIQSRERFGKMVDQLTYRSEFKGRLIRETTYGGKLVENITQAVARDVMVESMVRAERRGYPIIGTVHDELIAEVDEDFGSAHELEEIMRIRPKWASDAPINAEGWQGQRYRK